MIFACWGLLRRVDLTAASIFKHVGVPKAVFVHTYKSSEPYVNTWAREMCERIEVDASPLRPTRIEIDDLIDIKSRLKLSQYRSQPDPWHTKYETVDNFICAMYSKKRVTEMIRESGIEFDTVVFIRPDVQFLGPVPRYIPAHEWVIPDFHLYTGFNDRFCMASKSTYEAYGKIFDSLLAYSKKWPLHSETVHARVAAALKIPVRRKRIRFQRIRMNGDVDSRDVTLVKT